MARNKKRADGRVQKRIYIGTVDGKKQYKSVYGRTDAEAERAAQEIRRRLGNGERIQAGDQPFRAWAARLLAKKEPDVSPSYFGGLQGRCNWWCNRIGDVPISDIVTSGIQEGINDLYAEGRAKKTLVDYRNTAHAIFELAERDRAIVFNPAKYVDIPRNATKSVRFALTEEERGWITTFPHRAQLSAMIMMYAGLRRGELLALTVNDIDFDARIIRVNKAIYYDGNSPKLKRGGKTDAATRSIPIPSALMSLLRTAAKDRSPFDLLVAGKDGKHMTESTFTRMWESYLSALNEEYGQPAMSDKRSRFSPGGLPMTIRNITPHCLRHTYATMLHAAGVDVVTAQRWMGHSDIKTTLAIYTHLDDKAQEGDTKKLDDYFANHADQISDIGNA